MTTLLHKGRLSPLKKLMTFRVYKLSNRVDNGYMLSFLKEAIQSIIASIIMVPAREHVVVRRTRK